MARFHFISYASHHCSPLSNSLRRGKMVSQATAPSWRRIGLRARPAWLLEYLMQSKKLRPAGKLRMANSHLSLPESTTLVAHLTRIKSPWPEPSVDKSVKEEEKPTSFVALYPTLKKDDTARGRKLFLDMECAKCHGEPVNWARPSGDVPQAHPRGNRLNSLLSQGNLPRLENAEGFFYDEGEAQDKNADLPPIVGPLPTRVMEP